MRRTPRAAQLAFAALLLASCAAEAVFHDRRRNLQQEYGKVAQDPQLNGCKVAVLDLNALAEEHGIPRCSLANIVVDARTQVPYLREFSTSKAGREKRIIPTPHYFSGNSAPWFTLRAAERAGILTSDVDDADVVLVDDYCYKLWWLSYIHSDKKDQLPGEQLFFIYDHMIHQKVWTENQGQRHVFFQSHTGFAHGLLGDAYEFFLCNTLANSMHVVNVRASRLRCKRVPYNPRNFVIAPGSVHYHEIAEFQEAERARLAAGARDVGRDFLLFFKGKCTPLNFTWKAEAVANGIAQSTVNVGKTMRVHIVKAIQDMGRDMRVACTGDASEMAEVQNERPHWEQMDEFMRSTFCLQTPGDSQTSRRLPEAIMAGCIPVFAGPPYHTMPFADQIDYSQFALFFRFKQTPWADSITIHWEIDAADNSQRPHHPTDAEWWVPDFPRTKEVAIEVEDAREMVAYLRELPAAEVARLQRAVQAVQDEFSYQERPGVNVTAGNMVLRAMCARARALDAGELEPVALRELPFDYSIAGAAKRAAEAGQQSGGGDAGVAEAEDGGIRVTRAKATAPRDPAAKIGDRARERRKRLKEKEAAAAAREEPPADEAEPEAAA